MYTVLFMLLISRFLTFFFWGIAKKLIGGFKYLNFNPKNAMMIPFFFRKCEFRTAENEDFWQAGL